MSEEVKKVEVIDENAKKENKKGFCIASMVLGIVALVFACVWFISIPCGILAIIFGIIGIKTVNKGMAISGLITGGIGLAISFVIFMALFMYGVTYGLIEGLNELDIDMHYRTHYNSSLYD